MALRFSPDEIYPALKYLADRTKAALADPNLVAEFTKTYRTTPREMYDYIKNEIEPAYLEARRLANKH